MSNQTPQFTLLRSSTQGVERILDDDNDDNDNILNNNVTDHPNRRSKLLRGLDKLKLGKSTDYGEKSPLSPSSVNNPSPNTPSKRLSRSLNMFHSSTTRKRSTSRTSDKNISAYVPYDIKQDKSQNSGKLNMNDLSNDINDWEKRAEKLALVHPVSPLHDGSFDEKKESLYSSANANLSASSFLSQKVDEELQHAIDLHEAGKLQESCLLFEKLADPNRTNHPMAQVLYGLSLRHGWGCDIDEVSGFTYLRLAASNSALLDQLAESSGTLRRSKGSKKAMAKGELILAIYELGNCFRFGWGCEKDSYAAKTYYETAARLGDTDAMVETAWCFLEGFGTKKDKYQAAQYYRMAEKVGRVEVGNSWIWKDKYN